MLISILELCCETKYLIKLLVCFRLILFILNFSRKFLGILGARVSFVDGSFLVFLKLSLTWETDCERDLLSIQFSLWSYALSAFWFLVFLFTIFDVFEWTKDSLIGAKLSLNSLKKSSVKLVFNLLVLGISESFFDFGPIFELSLKIFECLLLMDSFCWHSKITIKR